MPRSFARITSLTVFDFLLAACCVGFGAGAGEPGDDQKSVKPAKPAAARFPNVAHVAGIDFVYYNDPKPGRFFLPEIMGGGCAWLDFDGDGWPDLYFVNGCALPHDPQDRTHTSALYRNLGNGRFIEVGSLAGVDHNGYGQGTTSADFDNDGFADLVVTTWGQNTLYRNNGDGTFHAEPEGAGLHAPGPRWYLGAAPGDADRDGNLDL